jgi:MFS family permease
MLWSIGNGLTTGTLVNYLAMDLGARGVGLSLVLASPQIVSALRVAAPTLIRQFGTAKRTCLLLSLVSYLLIWGLPAVGLPNFLPRAHALWLLIALLAAHQLFEAVASAALWAWFADLIPPAMRGRYIGRRQALQLIVLVPALLASGWFADSWRKHHPEPSRASAAPSRTTTGAPHSGQQLLGYAIPNAVGAACLLASLVPLLWMPVRDARVVRHVAAVAPPSTSQPTPQPTSTLEIDEPRASPHWWTALGDPAFRRLLWYGCWLSLFNGLGQAAQNIYPKAVLNLRVLPLDTMRTGMRIGQIGVSLWAGRMSDRYGNRPMVVVTQLALLVAPVFFLVSTPDEPYWMAGAWACFAMYAALNVAPYNLLIKLAPRGAAAAYIAVYFGVTGAAYAGATVAGGWLFDALNPRSAAASVPPWFPTIAAWCADLGERLAALGIDRYQAIFAVVIAARLVGLLLAARLLEPGAWRWRSILGGRRPTHELPPASQHLTQH